MNVGASPAESWDLFTGSTISLYVVQSRSQGQKPGVLMSEGGGRWTPQLRLRAECPSSAIFFSSGPRGLDDARPHWSGRPPPAVQLVRANLSFRHTQKGCSPAIRAPCGPVRLTYTISHCSEERLQFPSQQAWRTVGADTVLRLTGCRPHWALSGATAGCSPHGKEGQAGGMGGLAVMGVEGSGHSSGNYCSPSSL